jgi:hypothetical protein
MSILDFTAKRFAARRPLAAEVPGRPPPEPAPEKELTASQIVHRGGEPPAWPSPDDLPEVRAARRQLKDAEENLARLRRDLDAARAASTAKAVGAEDLQKYLKDGKPPARDRDAQAAGERAQALQALLPAAQQAVEEARAAGRAAWEAAPAHLWSQVGPEYRARATEVAATLCAAARAQLKLRAFGERYFAFLRGQRLPEPAAVPPGLHPRGLRLEEAVFDNLLHATSPRPHDELVRLLEQFKAAGVLDYQAFDLRPLDAARATDESLLKLDDLVKEIAGPERPEPTPEPEKKGDRPWTPSTTPPTFTDG